MMGQVRICCTDCVLGCSGLHHGTKHRSVQQSMRTRRDASQHIEEEGGLEG